MPSVFVWPKVTTLTLEPWQPTLAYPARGIGMLWSPEERRAPPDALERLVGRTRATLLNALDSPALDDRTGRRARADAPAGSPSTSTVLRDAGLVCGRRVARSVLYLRSAEGDALVEASGGRGCEPSSPAAAAQPRAARPLSPRRRRRRRRRSSRR